MTSIRPEELTWTGLLAQWVNFAQAALAIPVEDDGPRWRESVPAVINLQAVTFALADLERLEADEQALARDKAQMLIAASVQQLRSIWGEVGLTPGLRELADDAAAALEAAAHPKP